MKILIIQQKMIGDVLTSSILFDNLKREYPKSELHYLINSNTYPVVINHPNIDHFIFFTPEIKNSNQLFFKLCKKIKLEHYDTVIDVYGKWSSNFISYSSKAKIRISYYKWYTSFFYTHPIKRRKTSKQNLGLAIEHRLQLLEPICSINTQIKPKIYLTEEEITNAKNFLEEAEIQLKKPLFMISVLGSGNTKTYPYKYMAQIIDQIVIQTNGQILFNYIPSQETAAKEIFNKCTLASQSKIYFNVFGRSLREFIAITKHCNALIGNEGGAINMAKAVDIPTFAIFSPWISKESWNLYEDDKEHMSVHLKDFYPEIYADKLQKQLKPKIEELYLKFKSELFKEKLERFLEQF